GELSKANLPFYRTRLLEQKDICFGNKGFYGTPLPLIPDIRKSEVSEGVVGKLLEIFGVAKKFERQVTLNKGPNKRSNRYLVFQYERLIKSVNGTIVRGNSDTPSHVVWEYNFYELSKVNLKKKDRKYLKKLARNY
ncbi:MAG TPA: hypothetical protein VEP90_05815, partial [Methylomirabilota bacterium]|nr:hypothetical protein [Methylomirabilota bacterium]